MIEKLKKSVKIKTWYTKEEVFKFSSFLYETDLDANMVRYWDSKSTCKSLFDDKIIRLVQRWDFESLRSRTYVFTGSKRLNKTHFEDEFGEKGWFSNIQNKSLKSYRKSHKSLKYRSSTLTWHLLLLSGIHTSNPCMTHAAWVNFDIFSNHNLNVFLLKSELNHRHSGLWIPDKFKRISRSSYHVKTKWVRRS